MQSIPDTEEPSLDALILAKTMGKARRPADQISAATGLSLERVERMMPELTYSAPRGPAKTWGRR